MRSVGKRYHPGGKCRSTEYCTNLKFFMVKNCIPNCTCTCKSTMVDRMILFNKRSALGSIDINSYSTLETTGARPVYSVSGFA